MSEFVLVWLVTLTATDLAHRRLPNRLTMPGLLAALASGCVDLDVAAAVGVTAIPYLAAVMTGGCGGGDLKLAVALGAMVGDPARAAAVVVVAAVLTCVAIVGSAVLRREGEVIRRRTVAHGPALAAAAIMVGGILP